MIQFGLHFHHFGLAVDSPERAFLYLKTLGYQEGHQAYDPLQRVNVAMRHHVQMPDVEVIWPGDEPSPIDKLIKRGDGRIYHLCYTVRDAAGALAAMEAAGLDLMTVSEPLPAILFGGESVSFHHIAGFGLIELIHTADSTPSVLVSP